GQVAGVLLEPAEQGGEPGAAPQGDHPGAFLQEPVVVDDLGEGPVPPREEGAEDGLGQLVERVQDDAETEGGEQPEPRVSVKELEGQVVKDVWEHEARTVDVSQRIADAQANQDHPDHQEDRSEEHTSELQSL